MPVFTKLCKIAVCLAAPALFGMRAAAQEKIQPSTSGSAVSASLRSVRIPRVTRPPRLNDFLDGQPREAEAVVTGFVQREPQDGKPASQATTAYLSYDDRNFYVVFVCSDERGKVRANMAKREEVFNDDHVAVYLDTFRDRQRAYGFASNPLGIQSDAIHTDGQKADGRFDTVWYSEGRVTDDGFIVWMAIPFKSLRFARLAGQTWGIGLSRSSIRTRENSYWPAITRRQEGFVRQLATAEGIEEISPAQNIQLTPYFTGANAHTFWPNPAGYRNTRERTFGLDSKIVIRDALTLDLTVNPDFSQVESDDPQVTINQRFEVYFPEKRPFFIENAGYFATPINLFFSRRIVEPDFGARLTGKLGRWALGALVTDDRADGRRLLPTDRLFGHRAINGVVRVAREFGEQSQIGLMATSRSFGPSWNRVLAVDTRLKLTPNWYFTGQMARSFDYRSNGRQLKGSAATAQLMRTGRHFTYLANYSDLSPDFTTPLGFIQRVNIRQMSHYAGYFWQPENSRVINAGPSLSSYANWDRAGRITDWGANADFGVDFKGPTGFHINRFQGYEWYLGRGFNTAKNGVSFYTDRLKWLSLYGSISRGSRLNYSPSWMLSPYAGASVDASLGFAMRPTSRMRVENFYYYDRLATQERSGIAEYRPGTPVFNTHLYRAKVNYQFTKALSFRGILDYYAVLPNSALVAQENFKRLTGDLLFTYMLHPGTALYFGYNNRYENLSIDPTWNRAVREQIPPTLLTSRQFYIKLSYLIRL